MNQQRKRFGSYFSRVTTSASYLPEVDGLRFLAIVWVVLFHIQGSFIKKTSAAINIDNGVHTVLVNGDQGVLLFFMISGFILCMPFARQYALHQQAVSLKSYFFRRIVRIEPPYIIVALIIFFILAMRPGNTYAALLPHLGASIIYLHSILFHQTSTINVVFWSLEIEVQFYILAPVLTWLYFSAAPATRRCLALLLILVLPLGQVYTQQILPMTLFDYLQFFLMGFVVCDLFLVSEGKFFKSNAWIAAIAMIGMLAINFHHSLLEKLVLPFAMGTLFLFVMFNVWWKKVFALKYVAIIGGMCYSIYLIHFQLIGVIGSLSMRYTAGDNFYINLLLQCVIIIPVVLIVSAIFFLLIEKPFMQIKLHSKK